MSGLSTLIKRMWLIGVFIHLAACNEQPVAVDTTIETTAQTPLPSTVETYETDQSGAGASQLGFSDQQNTLIADYELANSGCRGGSGDEAATWHQCALRDVIQPKMRSANLCYGKDNDASAAEMTWHICQPDSLSYNEKLKPPIVGRCKVSVRGSTLLSGNCLVLTENGGSFWIMDSSKTKFAAVQRSPDDAQALVHIMGSEEGGNFGNVVRNGACWGNADVELCAWAK